MNEHPTEPDREQHRHRHDDTVKHFQHAIAVKGADIGQEGEFVVLEPDREDIRVPIGVVCEELGGAVGHAVEGYRRYLSLRYVENEPGTS